MAEPTRLAVNASAFRYPDDDAMVSVLSRGESVVLVAEGRAIMTFCAISADTRQMAQLIRYSSGFVQVALPDAVCDRLLLPEAAPSQRSSGMIAAGQCVAVDAISGVTTGISANDRAITARTLAQPRTSPSDLTRPGHVVPIRVKADGGQARAGAVVAAALALVTAASGVPAAVIADLVSVDFHADVMRCGEAEVFAASRGLAYRSI
ncbi:3,4-dihydroxy-2-butanone-4-phosphate synthase [Nocardia sp. NPDC059246]|uniref:3,4-dihydroxy-2-butanone-4-phosphate synthase n=1 Tax=unclassified Nocardia TaxID=2637762 RepID=UPI0036CE2785